MKKQQSQSNKVGKPITYTDKMLENDLKLFLKNHTIEQANPSSLGKFSCDKSNLDKKLTHGIARHVWMNRYKDKLKTLKTPTALIINHPNGHIDMWPSAYDIVYNLNKTEQLAATQRLITVAMDFSSDIKTLENLKTKIDQLNDENKKLKIKLLALKDDIKWLRKKNREEALDSLNSTRRKEKQLDNILDMRKKSNAEKGCSGDFHSKWPELFSAAQEESKDET